MTILKTKDYQIFKKKKENRETKDCNIDKLVESMSIKNMLMSKPVIVDKNMEVIDGQNRIEAAKRLKIDVYYIVDEDAKAEDMILLNAYQQKWQLTDYLHYYCESGKRDYIQLEQFCKQNELSIMQFRLLINESFAFSERFKRGKFVFPKQDNIDKLNKSLHNIRLVQEFIQTKIPDTKIYFKGSIFTYSLLEFFNTKKVDVETFMQKLEYKLEALRPCTNRMAYISMFKTIYNWKNSHPIEV